MRQRSLAAVLFVGLVFALLTALQPAAAAQACSDCPEMAAVVAHCQPEADLAAPQARSGWPVPGPAAQPVARALSPARFDAGAARAARLSGQVPEVRNLSIALLNLRQ